MKYKTAFRLAVRLVGMFLIAENLPYLVSTFASFTISLAAGRPSFDLGAWQVVSFAIRPVISVLAGLYLFFGGAWIINRVIPHNRPYCPECGYETTGLPAEGVCPECGTAYRRLGRIATPA